MTERERERKRERGRERERDTLCSSLFRFHGNVEYINIYIYICTEGNVEQRSLPAPFSLSLALFLLSAFLPYFPAHIFFLLSHTLLLRLSLTRPLCHLVLVQILRLCVFSYKYMYIYIYTKRLLKDAQLFDWVPSSLSLILSSSLYSNGSLSLIFSFQNFQLCSGKFFHFVRPCPR